MLTSPLQLSGLSYFRDFFSASAFDHEELANDDRIPSYRAYADGTLPPKQGPFTHMTVLRRGRNKRVDVFLDWLVRAITLNVKGCTLTASRKRAFSPLSMTAAWRTSRFWHTRAEKNATKYSRLTRSASSTILMIKAIA